MTSDAAGADGGDRHLVWVTIEETPEPRIAARIENLLLEHHITVRVIDPGLLAGATSDAYEVQIPEPDLERALDALEELDDIPEP